MAVRNFYISGRVDGRKTLIEGGPRSADGGFSLKVFQRDEGEKRHVLSIYGFSQDEELVLGVVDETSKQVVLTIKTQR